jgi:hypothetical protein
MGWVAPWPVGRLSESDDAAELRLRKWSDGFNCFQYQLFLARQQMCVSSGLPWMPRTRLMIYSPSIMPILTRKIASLSDFIDQILSLRDMWQKEDAKRSQEAKKRGEPEQNDPLKIWFRGQANARWKLVPKLYRLKNFNENEIRTEFKQRGLQLMNEGHVPKDEMEWYFLMQHFGTPTRLLDWTDGALIALYFAVRDQNKFKNAAVWMIDPNWFNDELLNKNDPDNYVSGVLLPDWREFSNWFPDPFEQPLHVSYPIAVDPPHVARRVSVQRSRFTIHGKSKTGIDVIAAAFRAARFVKFVIPNDAGKKILGNLETCGIVETSVFPDLEGLSRELVTRWTKIKPNT